MTLNTLRLLRDLLLAQTINIVASREEIDAVLAARDELDTAIAKAEKAQ